MNKANFIEILVKEEYPSCYPTIFELPIIQYLYKKTRSVTRGSKARSSFGNIYAIYVLVEDYFHHDFTDTTDYDGMRFSDAFKRQRELPFGEKLQNHALNHRCNQEFIKYFPDLANEPPIIRDKDTSRYWINEYHLKTTCDNKDINLAHLIMKIIERYIDLKKADFEIFFSTLEDWTINEEWELLEEFIQEQLNPQVNARIFEIVSFCILRQFYSTQKVFFGANMNTISEETLELYRTGRTNSNDGGVDFILRPVGRIFQVTEVLDFRKYFLDIDKVNKYPITFVVKVDMTPEQVYEDVKHQASILYLDSEVRKTYLNAFEEIITIYTLSSYLKDLIGNEQIPLLTKDIVRQCKVEFNIPL